MPLLLLVLFGLPAVVPALSDSSQQRSTVAIREGRGPGEISLYTTEGQLLTRWTGFSDIQSVETTVPGRLMVLDGGGARFAEIDRLGNVHRDGAFQQRRVFQVVALPSGHFLIAAGKEGVLEINGVGDTVWHATAPEAAAEVVSVVHLADGTSLCAARFAAAPLYQIPAGSSRLIPVAFRNVEPFKDPWQRPKLRVLDSSTQQVALWYGPWSSWYRFEWKKGGFESLSTVSAKGSVSAVARGRGGSTWVAESRFEVIQLSASGAEISRLAIADEIRDIQGAEGGGVFVAVERTPDAERLAYRRPSPNHTPFSWSGLVLWLMACIFFVGVLQLVTWRNAADKKPHVSTLEREPSALLKTENQSRRPRGIAFAAAAAVGLAVTSLGYVRLYQQKGSPQAFFFLAGGALLTVAAGQWWSRVVCGEPDRWWLKAREARFPRELLFSTSCAVATLLVGGVVLWNWQSRGAHENESIALWASLQALSLGVAALSPFRPRLNRWNASRETLIHVAGLLLLSSIVLGTDLASAPRNVHNDVGSVVDAALRLVEGRVEHFFTGGYAEIPYPGHLPASLGLLIGGKNVAGSRLGGALIGILAVLGTYALGREYRNPRVGLFASVLLLASIPFLHFSRSTPFGEVAAYSAWLLYLLLRAVRTAHPGAWLLLGVVGGWGLLLFYSARVALMGVVVAGILLSLRSYRVTIRRWFGPPLFVIGFAIVVVPMVPYWLSHRSAFFHRMDTSFSLYDPKTGFHPDVAARAVGRPFVQTLGMFYTERDKSGQGTLSPAAGPVEAILLSVGIAAAVADGWGANVACVGWFAIMLLGCGAFAEATPWYTRLVATTPVASLFMARALDLLLDILPTRSPTVRRVATAVVSAALIGLAAKNRKTYLQYEHAKPATEFTAFGRAALDLGPKYQFYCVTFQRPEFTCLNSSFLPYLASFDVHDIHDPVRAMPFPGGRPVAIMIPFQRFVPRPLDPNVLVREIMARYPAARLLHVYGDRSDSPSPIGAIVVAFTD